LRQRLLVGAAVVVLAAVASYLALIIVTRVDALFLPGNEIQLGGLSGLPGVDSNGAGEDSLSGGRINILVMGLDRRPREGEAPARTDTLFVLTIDPHRKTAGILGIPRDLWVEIPGKQGGTFEERINSAYVIGTVDKYDGGGPGLATEVVERALGISIHHYVVVDFEGFVDVIDGLGGIDVEVPEEIYDPYYSWTELPGDYDPQYFETGLQHMDGLTALAYARIRRSSDDLDRIQRQQRIMFAVMDKALSLNVLAHAVDLWKEYKDAVDSDFNDLQIPGLAALAAQIPPDRVSALSLGPATVPYITSEGAAILLADDEGIQRIVQALFSDQQLLEEEALVEVQNGTGREGLASEAVSYFVEMGFPASGLVAADAADGLHHTITEIVDFSGKTYTAQRLADWLGLSSEHIRAARSEDGGLTTISADIVVILGDDADIDVLRSRSQEP
jgi:LCP family protein required for cell wall assembly